MEKFASFILENRNKLFILLTILAIICAFVMPLVIINTDMTQYLPDESQVKAGIEILNAEFGDRNTAPLHVMFEGLDERSFTEVYAHLNNLENVMEVAFEWDDPTHVVDEFFLFTLTLQQGLTSDEEYALVAEISDIFSEFDFEMSGDIEGVDIDVNMILITIPTVIILTLILFFMCHSWFEPIIFFINIGIAILINMGSNVMFDSISDVTQMIAGLLQVVLSMDYSIIFLNRYRLEKEMMVEVDHFEAMKRTIRNSFSTISGISFTTIVGMLMLVFMSFTIGADIGFVIAKGVFISLICVFGVMPALILWFDKLIDKTTKPALNLKMNGVGRFSYKVRYLVAVLFVILFAGAYYLQNQLEITYSEVDYDPVHQVFDLDNTFIVLYENADEENIESFIYNWKTGAFWLDIRSVAPHPRSEHIRDIYAYSTTVGQSFDEAEMAAELEMEELMVGLLFRNYFLDASDILSTITLGEFLQFLAEDVADNELFDHTLQSEDLQQLDAMPELMNQQLMMQEVNAFELANLLEMNVVVVGQILQMYDAMGLPRQAGSIELGAFLDFLQTYVATNPMFTSVMSPEELLGLEMLPELIMTEMLASVPTVADLSAMLQMEEAMLYRLLYLYDLSYGDELYETMTLAGFINYLVTDFAVNPMFAPFFDADILTELEEAHAEITDAISLFVSDNFSRMMIHTTFYFESNTTFRFMDALNAELEDLLTGDFYILGMSAMPHELHQTFPAEHSFITYLTTIAFFIVVALTFKSIIVSIILATAIQGAVFVTMGVTYFGDGSMMFLPLIIAQVLLKSRVIDYGILYTANYIESRKTLGVKEAIIDALDHSIGTILTSGLIIVLVTFVVGLIFRGVNVAIAEILLLIAQGCFIGVVLSIFVLPSLIAVFDKFITKSKTNI